MPKAIVIEDEQLQHAVKVTKVSSPEDGNHDAALLLTCFGTGMTVTEICRLRMSDYLTESCTVLIDFEVRVEIAYNHRSRPLCWTSKKLTNADSLTQMKIGVLLCKKLSMNDGSPTQGRQRATIQLGSDSSGTFIFESDKPPSSNDNGCAPEVCGRGCFRSQTVWLGES